MSAPEIVKEASRWLRYAAEDLDDAEHLFSSRESAPRNVCFFAQQSAEKALKAVLVLEEMDVPRRHDLDGLRNLLPSAWSVCLKRSDLSPLTQWAVEPRYPGDWDEPTIQDAEQALLQARRVYDSIATEFEQRTNAG